MRSIRKTGLAAAVVAGIAAAGWAYAADEKAGRGHERMEHKKERTAEMHKRHAEKMKKHEGKHEGRREKQPQAEEHKH